MKKIIALFDIDYTLFNTDEFKKSKLKSHIIYDEVEAVLLDLSTHVDLGIFSEGEKKLQHAKLEKTKIIHFFQKKHIHIVESKEKELQRVLEKYNADCTVFFIDDKLTVLFLAKQLNHLINTVWVKRGKYAVAQEPIEGFSPDWEVNTLEDVVEIIVKKG